MVRTPRTSITKINDHVSDLEASVVAMAASVNELRRMESTNGNGSLIHDLTKRVTALEGITVNDPRLNAVEQAVVDLSTKVDDLAFHRGEMEAALTALQNKMSGTEQFRQVNLDVLAKLDSRLSFLDEAIDDRVGNLESANENIVVRLNRTDDRLRTIEPVLTTHAERLDTNSARIVEVAIDKAGGSASLLDVDKRLVTVEQRLAAALEHEQFTDESNWDSIDRRLVKLGDDMHQRLRTIESFQEAILKRLSAVENTQRTVPERRVPRMDPPKREPTFEEIKRRLDAEAPPVHPHVPWQEVADLAVTMRQLSSAVEDLIRRGTR